MKTKRINIGLVEVGDSFGGQYYFPYSVGILRAYAEKKLASRVNYKFLPIIYRRGNTEQFVDNLCRADIIFFSSYLWNFKASLDIAQKVKRKRPEILNVFGGPQVPDYKRKLSAFLRKYPYIDIASFGAGEMPFLRIIENYADRKWDVVPSIGYRRADGTIAFNAFKEIIQDINKIPSPYLTGVFDELIQENPEEKWQGRIETNRGCPFTCAFCYWGKKSERKIAQFDLDRIYSEIDWLSNNDIEFVFCCDANFGILKRDFEIARKVAENKKATGYPKVFSIQNTKNSREGIFELQKILNDADLQKGVNLALQSLNKETLKHIGRSNIDNSTYAELQRLFAENSIPTFTDLIIGLPGETYESFTNGVSEIIASGQHNRIQFINLTILENTLMAEPGFQKEHGLKIVETELIPHHSSLDTVEDITETQRLVTATRSMPGKDWIRTRVFSWMASLLYFDKLLQIPFIVLHETCEISYKDLIEIFMKRHADQKILNDVLSAFRKKAAGIQKGGSEYSKSKEWLNLVWYPDELMLITMSAEGKTEEFYSEAENRLLSFAKNCTDAIAPAMISQAVRLNRFLLKQPFITEDLTIECDYNIWEFYQAALRDGPAALKKGSFKYLINRTTQQWKSWDEWCREVIWYGNKRGDYIYSVEM